MTKELSTKVTKLDLDFILDNCFKPALWDKQWTIFNYDGYVITFEVASIDTKRKSVRCFLKLLAPQKSYGPSWSEDINFQKDHRNLGVIQKGINGSIFRWLIRMEEAGEIMKTTAYKEAKDYEDQLKGLAKEKAEALLDELNISNEDVREAYIDSQENKASTSAFTSEVLRLYEGSKLTKLYLSYALFANEEESYKKYKKIARANGFKIGDLRKEIKAELAKIESGEMYENLELDPV
jgi:hypothetical protein